MQDDFVATDISSTSDAERALARVIVMGEIDVASAPLMRDAALTHIEAGRSTVVDLAGVSFLDASGVSALMLLHRRAQDLGVRFTITNTEHRPVALVLGLTRANEVLVIE